MPGSDREVFDLFRSNGTAALEVRYLAYALFTFEKSEWADHFAKRIGRPPAQADVDDWIANLSDHRFEDLRRQAVDLFDIAARNYLREEMEAADERALGSAIVAQVRNAGSFWKQLGLALATAIVAPILLGGVILGAKYYSSLPTPADIAAKGEPAASPAERKPSGQPPSSPP